MSKGYQFSNVSSSRGAPMGRCDVTSDADVPIKLHLAKVPMVDGCYDPGGAYWGAPDYRAGVHPLYVAWGDGPTEQQRVFVRAENRGVAKALVRDIFIDAKFYR